MNVDLRKTLRISWRRQKRTHEMAEVTHNLENIRATTVRNCVIHLHTQRDKSKCIVEVSNVFAKIFRTPIHAGQKAMKNRRRRFNCWE
jgi:hypothetical protein